MATAGTAYIEIRAKMDRLNQDITSGMRSVSSKMNSVGKTMTRTVTLPILVAGAAVFKASEEQAQAQAKLDAVLKSTGGTAGITAEHVQNLASNIQSVTTYGDEAVIQASALMLTFKDVRNEMGEGNDVFDRSIRLTADLSAALGQDLQSSTIQLGKALNDPVRGVTALRRVGVSFTDQQQKQIKTMTEAGDVLGAQTLILEEVETQFSGTAEKMAKTAGGQMKQAMNSLGDAAEEVGVLLAPALKKVSEWAKKVADWFRKLSPESREMVVRIVAIAAAIGPLLIVAAKLINAFMGIRTAFVVLSKLLMANPYVLLVAATVTLVVVIVKNWDKIKKALGKAWSAISKAGGKIWDTLKAATGELLGWLTDRWADWLSVFFAVARAIVGAAAKAFGWIPGIGDKIKKSQQQFDEFTDGVVAGLRNQANSFRSWGDDATTVMARVAQQWRNFVSEIGKTVSIGGAFSYVGPTQKGGGGGKSGGGRGATPPNITSRFAPRAAVQSTGGSSMRIVSGELVLRDGKAYVEGIAVEVSEQHRRQDARDSRWQPSLAQ